jgi:ABC-type transport system involved in Fe-S cluster assembly fused permease/ATPase subunit
MAFRNVSFAYEQQANGNAALTGIDFKLPVGRSVDLLAASARAKHSGATRARLFDVTSGRFGRQDVRQLRCASCAKLWDTPQDPFLFSLRCGAI